MFLLPDEGVDLVGLDIVQGLNGLLYLSLVSGNINNEDQGVVLLDLLESSLSGQGVLDHIVSLGALGTHHGLGDNLGVSGQLQSLRAVEVHLGVHGSSLAATSLLKSSGGLLGYRIRKENTHTLKIISYITDKIKAK